MTIDIQKLTKHYGSLCVLDHIDAQISKGEAISLIGPSGTGKSTFLRCLNRLEIPDSGHIFIDGEDILSPRADVCKLRRKMGMVFQSFNLFSHLTVIENMMLAPVNLLKLPRQEAYDAGRALLRRVGLNDKAFSYPDELSGGQKQRVAIARALAMNPEIILFDEPTSALDPTMVGEVLSVIRSLVSEGITMMIVTHEMKFARDVSSRVMFMHGGTIYEQGSPDRIFNNPQRPETRAFIQKIRAFTTHIQSKTFDYYAFVAGIEQFTLRYMIDSKFMYRIEQLSEELLLNELFPSMTTVDIQFSLEFSEENGAIDLTFTYLGAQYNPFDTQGIHDEISMMMLNALAESHEFIYNDGINTLKVRVAR